MGLEDRNRLVASRAVDAMRHLDILCHIHPQHREVLEGITDSLQEMSLALGLATGGLTAIGDVLQEEEDEGGWAAITAVLRRLDV